MSYGNTPNRRESQVPIAQVTDDPGTHVVFGVPFDSPEDAVLARKVLSIATLMSLLALASSIFSLITGFYGFIGIFPAIVLPLLGYCGVRYRQKFMVVCFSICNYVLVSIFIISLIVTYSTIGDYVNCACDPECSRRYNISLDRADEVCSNRAKYHTFYWLSLSFAIAMAVLQCVGGYYSSKLARTGYFLTAEAPLPYGTPVVGTYAVYPQRPPPGTVIYTTGVPPPGYVAYAPYGGYTTAAAHQQPQPPAPSAPGGPPPYGQTPPPQQQVPGGYYPPPYTYTQPPST